MPPKRNVRTAQKGPGRRTRNTQPIAAAPNARRNTPGQKPAGRRTDNSTGKRGRKAAKRPQIPKSNGRARLRGTPGKKDTTALHDPNCYKAENGDVYRPGDYAYVDSQQPELPYHICVIRDFKLARKDSVIAELKWFYRVSELPEATYSLLMDDRKKSKEVETFSNPKVNDRELFLAFNIDTHPASLFRGKCQVKDFSEIDNLADYLEADDSFFYRYGYKPESRRLTDTNEDSFIPQSLQADIPECISSDTNGKSPDASPSNDRYGRPEEKINNCEELVWKPHQSDDELLMYLRAARSIALHAGMCMNGFIADGYMAASSDETTQHAFDTLHKTNHSMERALQDLVKRPVVGRLMGKKKWTKENTVLFAKGMRQFGKNFHKIRKELLPNKEIKELTEYYYYWKKTNAGLTSRNTRRQRKQSHIRMSKAIFKPPEVTPEREFLDLSSCDEDEGDLEEGEKNQSYYACRHCFTKESPNWHHGGIEKAILCQDCRLYFQRYGCMRPLKVKREPPEFMFKEFHKALAADSQSSSAPETPTSSRNNSGGRKTRNSNGSRGIMSQPRLRSGKNYIKSDTDDEEEAEGLESSESSFEEELPPVSKPKLQTRHSMLDNLDEHINKQQTADEPPAKRIKREEENEAHDSEEEWSTTAEADQELSSQKSPSGDTKSPSHSSSTSSNGADDEGGSPYSSRGSTDRASSSVPQQFIRVSKDHESTCARTELVFVHPPAEEKSLETATTKVVTPFPGPASSSSTHHHHGDQPGPSSSSSSVITNTKVPMITPHAPQLPMGPGPFIGFPSVMPYPSLGATMATTPGAANPGMENPLFRRSSSMDAATAAASREREEMALMQQHQQQWLQAAMMTAQQNHLELQSQMPHVLVPHALHPHHPNAPQGFAPPPSHSVEHGQPMFNFPSPEEMAARQRMAAAQQMGLLEHFGMPPPGVLPPGFHPGLIMENVAHSAGRMEEHGGGGAGGGAAGGMVPTAHFMPAELVAQQQQAALVAAAAGGSPGIPMTAENVMEFQRQFEIMWQQVQKEPELLRHPQIQIMIQQRNRLVAMQQGVAMQEHYQRMHELSILQQQQQQQQEMHKQLALGRPGHEDSHRQGQPGIRPGVIMQTSK